MQFEVQGIPEEHLDRLEGALTLDLQHNGKLTRGRDYVAMKAARRDDILGRISRRSWFVVHLLLTLITLGMWMLVWVPLAWYQRRKRPHVRADVRAVSEDSVEITTAGSPEWRAALDAWIQRAYAVEAQAS